MSSLSFTRAFGSPTDVSEFLSVTSFFVIPSSLAGLPRLSVGGDLDKDSVLLWLLECLLDAVSFS